MAILVRENDALSINPPPAADNFLTTNGSNWLWAVTAIYLFTALVAFGHSFAARSGERFFHYLFIVANLVGTIAYFAAASDLGWSLVGESNSLSHGFTRQLFFVKYILWVVSFPVVAIALGVLSGVSWATILYNVAVSWIWVVSYLVGAYVSTNYKWGFFAFGTFAWLILALSTLHFGRQASVRVGVNRDYLLLAGWANLLWLLYPIAWGLSDGGNRIGVVASWIFFGILDVLLVPGLTYAILLLSRRWDYGRLNIAFTQYGRVATREGTFPEKTTAPAAAPAAAV
ncbi:putative heat shock protein 30 protein [Echria macrotheca]|uniref:Heat shock protein 30 protein n=1 Tax=Echria macrotheca TaxID=438768 RepID=A0AAJ0F454_9PEZI|nr:putative heat shock protein 30 protein [Echria macrotheca]